MAENKSGFVAEDEPIPFGCSFISLNATPHQIDSSRLDGRRDTNCSSARLLLMAHSEGAAYGWMRYASVSYDRIVFSTIGLSRAF
ncbi:hypothetical protein TNCV_124131 [Trichonephila clavipes]|nr:hypothetical protein TNCV_124131 [Trichonephila clavipes]